MSSIRSSSSDTTSYRRSWACLLFGSRRMRLPAFSTVQVPVARSEEHTSELQSLMRNSYAVFCLKKKKTIQYPIPKHLSIHTMNTIQIQYHPPVSYNSQADERVLISRRSPDYYLFV